MIYVKNILRYLLCVIISMIFFTLFILFGEGRLGFMTPNAVIDTPIHFGIGWIIYQYMFNKIHQQNLNYYWMIIKLTIQAISIMVITGVVLFIVLKFL